jgi:hypothetical protein
VHGSEAGKLRRSRDVPEVPMRWALAAALLLLVTACQIAPGSSTYAPASWSRVDPAQAGGGSGGGAGGSM